MVIKKSKVQAAPYKVRAAEAPKVKQPTKKHPLIEERKRKFGIGQSIQPKRDLTRFVKWPKYVRIQRQEKILKQRLKAPPSINQFNVTAEKKLSTVLFRFLKRYRPESSKEKSLRLKKIAKAKVSNDKTAKVSPITEKPFVVKYGLNHVTSLIEKKKASLVVIANDVYPIELVVWLPALCRKMGVPYVIIKNKARLGTIVGKKTATVACFIRIKPEHQTKFNLILRSIDEGYSKRIDIARKRWSTPFMGTKNRKTAEKPVITVAN